MFKYLRNVLFWIPQFKEWRNNFTILYTFNETEQRSANINISMNEQCTNTHDEVQDRP